MTDEGKITKWSMPDKFEIVDLLPKTSVGKIGKKVLRDLHKK